MCCLMNTISQQKFTEIDQIFVNKNFPQQAENGQIWKNGLLYKGNFQEVNGIYHISLDRESFAEYSLLYKYLF